MRVIDKNTLEKSLDKKVEEQDIDFYHYDDIEIITENKLKVKNGNQFTIIFSKLFLVSDGKKSIVKNKMLEKNQEIKFNQKAVTANILCKKCKTHCLPMV